MFKLEHFLIDIEKNLSIYKGFIYRYKKEKEINKFHFNLYF